MPSDRTHTGQSCVECRTPHLQCTTVGPAACGGLMNLTRRMNSSSVDGCWGTPWSGHAVNWNWRTSRVSLDASCTPYNTIRDAILTCARKPTWVSLIYRTEPTTIKSKKQKKLNSKNGYASNSKECGGIHVVNPEEVKGRAAVGRICRKGRFQATSSLTYKLN